MVVRVVQQPRNEGDMHKEVSIEREEEEEYRTRTRKRREHWRKGGETTPPFTKLTHFG
jgi:hypothetical protein